MDAMALLRTAQGYLVREARRCLAALPDQDCQLCDAAAGSSPFCTRCWRLLRHNHATCPCCGLPVPGAVLCGSCLGKPPNFDATFIALRYAFPADELIRRFKFSAQLPLGPILGGLLLEKIQTQLAQVDMILPMPLHPSRLAQRGFNQAVELLRPLNNRPGHPPVRLDVLQRTRATPAQADLPAERRKANVRGTIVCTANVRGMRIAVVDDVMTTGSTLGEVARVLKACGAARVENWVVARTWLD